MNGNITAQMLLNAVIPTAVDGVWGPQSSSNLELLPAEMRISVDAVRDGDLELLETSEEADMRKLVMAKNVFSALQSAAEEFSVPFQVLVAFGYIESRLNPLATNGSSRGLFQIQPSTWDEAKPANVGEYWDNWFKPLENARVCASLMLLNRKRLAALGHKDVVSYRLLYLAHQQGATGAYRIHAAAHGVNAEAPLSRNMLNNPAPGSNKTADPVQFYKNWMDYMSRLFH